MAAAPRTSKLIVEAKELIAKLHEIIIQLDAATAGENPVGDTIVFWKRNWLAVYSGADPYGETKQDCRNIKSLVTKCGSAEAQNRMLRYLADKDAFLVRQRHPLAIFFTRVNAYSGHSARAEGQQLDAPTVSDCRHAPRCASDQQHTDRKMAELRG